MVASYIYETESLNWYIEGAKPGVAAHLMHELPATLDEAIQMAERFDGSYGEASPFHSSCGSALSGPHTLGGTTSPLVRSSSIVGSSSGLTPMEVDNTERF